MKSPLAVIVCSVICASSPVAQVPFQEQGLARGIVYFTTSQGAGSGYGTLLCDLDLDGDPDVLAIGGPEDEVGVFRNDSSGFFTDVSLAARIEAIPGASGLLTLDYDGDGDLDVYFSAYGPNRLVRNDGGLVFLDVGHLLGVEDPGPGTGCSAGDVDGDGWQDIHVSNYGTADRFYHNNAGAGFVEQAASMGLDSDWRGFQSVLFDMDRDGDLDLYVSNDKKILEETTMRNQLFENVDGTLVNISSSSGTDLNIHSMGVAVGDFDGDGLQDLYATNVSIEPNPLLINQGNGLFRDNAAEYDVESFRTGWAAIFFDYDNDGHTDLYVCDSPPDPRNRMYVHAGGDVCVDLAGELGLQSILSSYGAAIGDIENDGDMDILQSEYNNWVQLHVNREGHTRNWIKFRVFDDGPNRFSVGAEVSVRTGTKWQRRQILTGANSFKSASDLTVHVGVDDAQIVDEVIVRWPRGVTSRLHDLEVNRTYVVRPRLAREGSPPSAPNGGGPVEVPND